MRVRVRGTSGVATLNVENHWTILDLKVAIEGKLKVPVKSQIRTCRPSFSDIPFCVLCKD